MKTIFLMKKKQYSGNWDLQGKKLSKVYQSPWYEINQAKPR